jgi:hypothetical protein
MSIEKSSDLIGNRNRGYYYYYHYYGKNNTVRVIQFNASWKFRLGVIPRSFISHVLDISFTLAHYEIASRDISFLTESPGVVVITPISYLGGLGIASQLRIRLFRVSLFVVIQSNVETKDKKGKIVPVLN